jgi:hypothetical protein
LRWPICSGIWLLSINPAYDLGPDARKGLLPNQYPQFPPN